MTLLYRFTIEVHGELSETEATRLERQLIEAGMPLPVILRNAAELAVAQTSLSDRSQFNITVTVQEG